MVGPLTHTLNTDLWLIEDRMTWRSELRTVGASAAIIIGILSANAVGTLALEVMDYPSNVIMVVLGLVLGSVMMSAGLDSLIKILGVVREEYTIRAILDDFPSSMTFDHTLIERRIVRMMLVKDNEIKMLEVLKSALDDRVKLRDQT